MTWVKDILLEFAKKLNSWEAFFLLFVAIGGYIYLEFYKAQTDRLARIPSTKPDGFVQNKSENNYAGIVKRSKPNTKSEK